MMSSVFTKVSQLTAVAVVAVFATACNQEISVEDGRLPGALVPWAKEYVGAYQGKVQRVRVLRHKGRIQVGSEKSAELRLALNGDKLIATSNVDYGGARCGSTIGDLKNVEFKGDRVTLDFDLDIGKCKPVGFYTYTLKVTGGLSDPMIRTEVVLSRGKYATQKVIGAYTR